MLDYPEPYLLAPSSLTPTALRERAESVVVDATLLASVPVDGLITVTLLSMETFL